MSDAGHKLVSCFAVARSASQWFMAQYSARLLLQSSATFPTGLLSLSPVVPEVPEVLEVPDAHAAHTVHAASQKIWESLMGRIGFFSLTPHLARAAPGANRAGSPRRAPTLQVAGYI